MIGQKEKKKIVSALRPDLERGGRRGRGRRAFGSFFFFGLFGDRLKFFLPVCCLVLSVVGDFHHQKKKKKGSISGRHKMQVLSGFPIFNKSLIR